MKSFLNVFNSDGSSGFSRLSLGFASPGKPSLWALGGSWSPRLCCSPAGTAGAPRSPGGKRGIFLLFLEPAQQRLPAAFKMIKTNLVPFMMEE